MKRRSPIAFGILIVLLVILVMQLDFTGLKNRMYPNTTFTKEFSENIRNKEVTVLLLMQFPGNTVVLKNKEDIDQIIDSLAPLKLKKENKIPNTSTLTYDIVMRNQEGNILDVSLFGTNYLMISGFKNSTHRYKITNDIDLDKIKKYLENEN
jgi:hypothetical protein